MSEFVQQFLFCNFVLDVVVFFFGLTGNRWFSEIITHTVANQMSCRDGSPFSNPGPCGIYTRVSTLMILALGIVRLFGAFDVFNERMLNLALLSYVIELVWFILELNAGSYSLHVSFAECTKVGESLCDLRTVASGMGLCVLAMLLLFRHRNRIRGFNTSLKNK